MIRLFNIFCKLNFLTKTAEQIFNEALSNINILDYPCPKCGSRHPHWSFFENYTRHLISYENGTVKDYLVTVPRYQCRSCLGTHALIPEIAVPYGSYSTIFILSALKDRYEHKMTVIAPQ